MLELHFNLVWPRIGNWKPLLRSYLVPVGLSCCFIVFLCCNAKATLTVEWDKPSEIRNGKLDSWYGLQDFGINFVSRQVQFNGWINTLDLGINSVSELSGSIGNTISPVIEVGEISNDKGHSKSACNFPPIIGNNVKQVIHKILKGALFALIIYFPFLLFTQRKAKPELATGQRSA